jgi:hypothetical protein
MRKTAANQCESENIHQSLMRKTAANQCESENIHQSNQEKQLQITVNLKINTSR